MTTHSKLMSSHRNEDFFICQSKEERKLTELWQQYTWTTRIFKRSFAKASITITLSLSFWRSFAKACITNTLSLLFCSPWALAYKKQSYRNYLRMHRWNARQSKFGRAEKGNLRKSRRVDVLHSWVPFPIESIVAMRWLWELIIRYQYIYNSQNISSPTESVLSNYPRCWVIGLPFLLLVDLVTECTEGHKLPKIIYSSFCVSESCSRQEWKWHCKWFTLIGAPYHLQSQDLFYHRLSSTVRKFFQEWSRDHFDITLKYHFKIWILEDEHHSSTTQVWRFTML